jgi:hypothetical protein
MSQLPNQPQFGTVPTTNDKNRRIVSIASTLGMVGGVYFAYKRKSSGWGYAGYGLLFSFVAGQVARMFFPVSWVQTAFQPNANTTTGSAVVVPPNYSPPLGGDPNDPVFQAWLAQQQQKENQ